MISAFWWSNSKSAARRPGRVKNEFKKKNNFIYSTYSHWDSKTEASNKYFRTASVNAHILKLKWNNLFEIQYPISLTRCYWLNRQSVSKRSLKSSLSHQERQAAPRRRTCIHSDDISSLIWLILLSLFYIGKINLMNPLYYLFFNSLSFWSSEGKVVCHIPFWTWDIPN